MAEIIQITDFDAPELDTYARLNERELLNRDKPENALFIAESPKVVERALENGYEPVSVLVETKHITGEAAPVIAAVGDIPVYTAEFDVLTRLTGYMLTRGVLCAMRRKPLPTVQNVLKNARRVAVLENVMNPTNVGAIFRSAAALGFDAVLLTEACSNPLYRRAIRVSMGTVFQIPWTFVDNDPGVYLEELRANGFKCAAMALRDNTVSITDETLHSESRLALILGSEGDGLKQQTIDSCDYTIKIPMSLGVDSLNVAASAAVAFWELGNKG